ATHQEYLARFPARQGEIRQHLIHIDRELANESAVEEEPSSGAGHLRDNGPANAAKPAQAITTVGAFIEALRQFPIVEKAHLDELFKPGTQPRWSDPRELAKELIRRGWLTPYQVNQVLQGRGSELVQGPYLLLERLGEGGTGQVFKVRQQKLKRIEAL